MDFLSPSKAARQLGVTKRTVINWFHDGVFPNAFQVKRAIKIPPSDVEALKQSGKKESA